VGLESIRFFERMCSLEKKAYFLFLNTRMFFALKKVMLFYDIPT